MPLALQRLLAPAMFLPSVVTELLNGIFILSKVFYEKRLPGQSGKPLYVYNHIIPGSWFPGKNKDEGNNMY
jgi:hypothetical protein